jgi:tetratricopeptide (TPR) repeat protein
MDGIESWVAQAAGLYNAGRYDLAEKLLDRALEAGHESPALRTLRCRCRTARRRYREAEAEARRALELQPEYPEALHALSWCAFRSRRIDQASEYIDEAVRLNPNESRYHHMRGIVRYARGKLAEALVCLDQALRLDPTNTAATDLKARILLERGSPARAEALARQALAIDPEDASLHETLAWTHLQNSRSDEAERHFRASLARDPMNVTAQSGLRLSTERLVSWKKGAIVAGTSVVLAGLGWADVLPSASVAAVVVAPVSLLLTGLNLVTRKHVKRVLPPLFVLLPIAAILVTRTLVMNMISLNDEPPEFWRVPSAIAAGVSCLASALAFALERRRSRA